MNLDHVWNACCPFDCFHKTKLHDDPYPTACKISRISPAEGLANAAYGGVLRRKRTRWGLGKEDEPTGVSGHRCPFQVSVLKNRSCTGFDGVDAPFTRAIYFSKRTPMCLFFCFFSVAPLVFDGEFKVTPKAKPKRCTTLEGPRGQDTHPQTPVEPQIIQESALPRL